MERRNRNDSQIRLSGLKKYVRHSNPELSGAEEKADIVRRRWNRTARSMAT